MAFKTSLVGLRAEGGYDTLATWDWNTDYTGQVGGILSIQQSASIAPDDFSGTGGVTITGMNGMPVTTFSAFRNKLETTRIGFELTSHFTLGSGSGGINPPAENVLLAVGSYVVMVPAGSFSKNREGDFVYEGTIGGEHLELRIVPGTANEYTLRAEASGTATITLGTRPAVELMIGNDMGVGTGKDKET